jgi:hypothetical protein
MGELCDGTDCPTAASCRDTNNCTEDSVTGSACQLVCAHDPIGAKPSPADQCCPPSTDKWQDTDCNARCGNSHIEIGEDCDPPNGSTCDATCNNVVIIPPPPTDGGT